MSKWRQLAFDLFPQHRRGLFGFQRSDMSIYHVFSELFKEAKMFHYTNNANGLQPIYTFAAWCFSQRYRAPDLWNAAATVFYEHLADDDLLASDIPYWVPEDIFVAMRHEFEERRERCGVGKFRLLLEHYNTVHQTKLQ